MQTDTSFPELQRNVSLRPYNTFGMDVKAGHLMTITDKAQLKFIVTPNTGLSPTLHILGGGSNVLLLRDVDGLILVNKLKGITVEREDAHHAWVRAQSGELWHDLVLFAIGNGWGGIENLALIPGTVGASPIQNIGAYGVEVKDTIESVEAFHWDGGKLVEYTNADCHFGYRDSIFKHELKDQVFITSVLFQLNKQPVFKTGYGAIGTELAAMNAAPGVASIAQAVMNIRRSKLPDPAQIGNAGSFFKNPTIPEGQFLKLKEQYPEIPSFAAGPGRIKVPAGWLIEQCGWKGMREGDAGVHAKQALVLVNYSNATGEEIWALSGRIVASINERFGVELEREVQVW